VTKPLLHIFIPAFGKSPYLREAIQSAIDSSLDFTPITVIDDASPTRDIWLIAQEFHPRVEYVLNKSNLGISGNFLNAYKLSTGYFTTVMGSDDRMLPGYESELRKTFDLFPNATVIQPKVTVIDSEGNVCAPLVDRVKTMIQGKISHDMEMNSKKLLTKLLVGDFLYFPAIAWKTEILTSASWNLSYRDAVDLDLLFKLSIAGEPFIFQSAETFRYRRHAESISSVLAQDDTRLREELAAHFMAKNLMPKSSTLSTRILVQLAPTVRVHALIIGLKQMTKSPLSGIRHLARSLMSIRPLN
jgi:glycosyltransferase involved in cell wall biosynthesis